MNKSKIKLIIIISTALVLAVLLFFLARLLWGFGGYSIKPLSYDVGVKYSLATDSNIFQRSSKTGTDRYTDTTDATGETFFEVRFIKGKESSSIAPSFLDSYIDFHDIEFAGTYTVGNTGCTGQLITAKNDDVTLEAYLIDREDGTFAVILSYSSDTKDEQMERLQSVFNSLTLE